MDTDEQAKARAAAIAAFLAKGRAVTKLPTDIAQGLVDRGPFESIKSLERRRLDKRESLLGKR